MFRAFCLALGLAGILSTQAKAQADGLIELYGDGVHRFFAGDLDTANQLFTRVIDSGTQDPRPYYFRGLIYEHQGGGGEADFVLGAQLEAEGNRAVSVGQALTRIQGAVRGKIERARRDARVAYKQKRMAAERERMESAELAPKAPDMPAVPGGENEGAVADPFQEGLRSDETTAEETQPALPEVDEATNPFADDPAPAMQPEADTTAEPSTDTDDPFSTGGEETSPDAGNPFGNSDDNPFGGDGGAANPFGGSDTPAAGDLFGDQ